MTSSSSRPGGLTALAVLNFVFGGVKVVQFLGILAVLGAWDRLKHSSEDLPAKPLLYYGLLSTAVLAFALIASGVGYLKQRRTLGRTLGNGYGVVSIADTLIQIAGAGQGFGIGVLLLMMYPVLTLALLNTTFKDDFVN